MNKQVEIYIRKSGERNLLMFHVPEELKEQLIEGIRNGGFETDAANIIFEMPVLLQWQSKDNPNHVRLKVNEITADYER